jgi:Zn-dependent M28 family amino/carboxypeptidase
MDMVGSPRGFNAMGSEHLIPTLKAVADACAGFDMSRGIMNQPWTNSDHQPFLLAGIPAITPLGHLDEHMVKTYHDFGDTFDLVNRKYLSEAAGVVAVLAHVLANDSSLPYVRRSKTETAEWLTSYKLDERLKRQGEWIFD